MNNDQFISRFEEVAFEYARLSKEYLSKRLNGDFSKDELERFNSIMLIATSSIIDSVQDDVKSVKDFKEGMVEGFKEVVNKCVDGNR